MSAATHAKEPATENTLLYFGQSLWCGLEAEGRHTFRQKVM
jgi:hypothetical protein